MSRTRPAQDLTAGDRITLHSGLVRTVSYVTDSGYVNGRNVPILAVYYAEGDTPEWSCGNTWAATSHVELAA